MLLFWRGMEESPYRYLHTKINNNSSKLPQQATVKQSVNIKHVLFMCFISSSCYRSIDVFSMVHLPPRPQTQELESEGDLWPLEVVFPWSFPPPPSSFLRDKWHPLRLQTGWRFRHDGVVCLLRLLSFVSSTLSPLCPLSPPSLSSLSSVSLLCHLRLLHSLSFHAHYTRFLSSSFSSSVVHGEFSGIIPAGDDTLVMWMCSSLLRKGRKGKERMCPCISASCPWSWAVLKEVL